ncbi:MAG: hypothetical protein ACI4WT_11105 [Oligosphaeraceae bacterium]
MTALNDPSLRLTGIRDPQAEILLREALRQLAAQLREHAPRGLRAVYLGGGYGRGEGGVRRRPDASVTLYNDLDCFVVADDHLGRAERAALVPRLAELARPLEPQLGIDIDFSPPKGASQLRSVAPTLMFQEFRRGYVTLFGDDALPQTAIPERPAHDLPLSEALRLMLNRGMGLLLAGESLAGRGDHPGHHDFILRNLNKAILGCGDALLIARHAYDWSLHARLERLQHDTPDAPHGLASRYRHAIDFKFAPHDTLPPDPRQTWRDLRLLWRDTLAAIAELPDSHSMTPADVRDALHRLCRRQPGARSLRHALRWLVRTRRAPKPLARLGDDPIALVLAELADVLLVQSMSPDSGLPDIPETLRQHWRHFN